jgi:hypothetical protein
MPNNDAVTSLYIAANRDRKMYWVLRRYHEGWWEKGGGLMCAFSASSPYTKWGSWGYLEYQDQPLDQAHKYRALLDAMRPPKPPPPPG